MAALGIGGCQWGCRRGRFWTAGGSKEGVRIITVSPWYSIRSPRCQRRQTLVALAVLPSPACKYPYQLLPRRCTYCRYNCKTWRRWCCRGRMTLKLTARSNFIGQSREALVHCSHASASSSSFLLHVATEIKPPAELAQGNRAWTEPFNLVACRY